MNWLYDSHIHLSDSEYDDNIHFIINSMKKMKIKACCVSEDLITSKKTIEISKNNELIFPFVGIHPGKAEEKLEPVLELIKKNASDIAGIGEIGLDPTYVKNESDFPRQEKLFRSQLSVAEKLQKPISIHSRKSLDEIYDIIPSYSLKATQESYGYGIFCFIWPPSDLCK